MLFAGAGQAFAGGNLATPKATTYGIADATCPQTGQTTAGPGATVAPSGLTIQANAYVVACVNATETISAGTLYFNQVNGVQFNGVQLNGFNQEDTNSNQVPVAATPPGGPVTTASGYGENVDLTDATGSDFGWSISILAPDLTISGGVSGTASEETLPTADFDSASAAVCDTYSTCSASGVAGSSDIALNSAKAVPVVNGAAGGTSVGALNFNFLFDQPIPADQAASNAYTATWTYTLSSTPATLGTNSDGAAVQTAPYEPFNY